MLQLQCGHGSVAVENRPHPPGRCPRCSGFNAATARSQWRTQQLHRRQRDRLEASMRPRLARRGELVAVLGQEHLARASMGPRLGSRGEHHPTLGRCLPSPWLQCGHSSVAVENVDHSARRGVLSTASMRPRLGSRGEPTSISTQFQWRCQLQCGHGSLAVENNVTTNGTQEDSTSFNAATAQ